jgi:Zn-dependent oligopeptidase
VFVFWISHCLSGCLQEGELEALEKGVEPAWGKLVVPLERIVDRLDVVWNVVDHLKAVKDSADLRAAVEDVQVPLSPSSCPVSRSSLPLSRICQHMCASR